MAFRVQNLFEAFKKWAPGSRLWVYSVFPKVEYGAVGLELGLLASETNKIIIRPLYLVTTWYTTFNKPALTTLICHAYLPLSSYKYQTNLVSRQHWVSQSTAHTKWEWQKQKSWYRRRSVRVDSQKDAFDPSTCFYKCNLLKLTHCG